MNTSETPVIPAGQDEVSPAVLAQVAGMIEEVLGEYGLADAVEITMDTTLQGDLELESVDLVALAGHVQARYAGRVDFAEFIAGLDLDELIGLTVGQLVDYVVARLRETAPAGGR